MSRYGGWSWTARLRAWVRPARRPYDEWSFWNSRLDPNAFSALQGARLERDVSYIREHVSGCAAILEFGPGTGRTFAAHSPTSRISCYDITANYRDRLFDRTRELGLDVRLDLASSLDAPLPYEDDAFDAAVASKVFLHQRPDRIERVMAELARVARRVVVVTSIARAPGEPMASHCFHHDYPAICTRIGCEMTDVRDCNGTLWFLYGRSWPPPALR